MSDQEPQGLIIHCDGCDTILTAPGGLMFSPPVEGSCEKLHLCSECWAKIRMKSGFNGGFVKSVDEISCSRFTACSPIDYSEKYGPLILHVCNDLHGISCGSGGDFDPERRAKIVWLKAKRKIWREEKFDRWKRFDRAILELIDATLNECERECIDRGQGLKDDNEDVERLLTNWKRPKD